MNLPKTLKLGPHTVAVCAVKNLQGEKRECLLGQALPTAKKVLLNEEFLVNAEISDSMKLVVLMHELVHLSLASVAMTEDDEERVAEALGENITQLLIDNPKLTKVFDEFRRQKERGTKVQLR